MKMLHDCDFLDRVKALRLWLGFSTSRNPFFLPPKAFLRNHPGESLENYVAKDTDAVDLQFDKIGFAGVGKQPWLGPLEMTTGEERKIEGTNARKRIRKERKGDGRNLAPYTAPVINDPILVPTAMASSPTRAGRVPASTDDSVGEPIRVAVHTAGIVPNLVSRDDMRRVEAARQALEQEEARVLEEMEPAPNVGERKHRAVSGASETPGYRTASQGSLLQTGGSCRKRTSHSTASRRDKGSRGKESMWGSSLLDETGDGKTSRPANLEFYPLVLTAAGVGHQPPPEPHPGLGPVLLRSDLQGGELHRNPFVHTTESSVAGRAHSCEPAVTVAMPDTLEPTVGTCSTAPSMSSPTNAWGETRQARRTSVRFSSNHRAATAPSTISSATSDGGSLISRGQGPNHNASCPQSSTHISGGLSLCEASRVSYRKAGAELSALTAAGTTGRRQPPPREVRLRRLARDVARHSVEIRELARSEKQLRRRLSYFRGMGFAPGDTREKEDAVQCGENVATEGFGRNVVLTEFAELQEAESADCFEGGTRKRGYFSNGAREAYDVTTGGECVTSTERELVDGEHEYPILVKPTAPEAAERVKALLREKRREIESKIFDLGLKRDELRCLRMVQKQERTRKRTLEIERRRFRLNEGEVRVTFKIKQRREGHYVSLGLVNSSPGIRAWNAALFFYEGITFR